MFKVDKVAHFGVSGMIYLAFFAGFYSFKLAFIGAFIIGLARELHWWKSDSVWDMAANMAGILTSQVCLHFITNCG